MTTNSKNPIAALQAAAAKLPDVTVGTACNQTSYKINNKAFIFVGPQGGRYKAMFKLNASIPQAQELAAAQPDAFEVGKLDWVSARFTGERPLPKKIWSKWLKESYQLTRGGGKASAKKVAAKKKSAKKTKIVKNTSKRTPRKSR